MTTNIIQVTPSKNAAIYEASLIILKCGPMLRVELFAAMDFGPEKMRETKLRAAFDTDWLRETPSGHLDLTDYSKRQLVREKPKAPYVGQAAPPAYRGNVFAGQGLSKRYIPNRRGPRADVPAWSVKPDGYNIKSIGGGDAA